MSASKLLHPIRRGLTVPRNWARVACWSAADLIFPPCCVFCGGEAGGEAPPAAGGQGLSPWNPDGTLCVECHEELSDWQGPACPRCASPLPRGLLPAGDCIRCRHRRYHFSAAVALGIYRGSLQRAVLRTKWLPQEPLLLAMADMLADRLRPVAAAQSLDLVVPVPMYWLRRLVRGSNPAETLAEAVAWRLGLPVRPAQLRCRRRLRKQGTLSPTQRLRNVRQAFELSRRFELTQAKVLLVDDIMTTGATASEAARALRRGGAQQVTVAVVARAVGTA